MAQTTHNPIWLITGVVAWDTDTAVGFPSLNNFHDIVFLNFSAPQKNFL